MYRVFDMFPVPLYRSILREDTSALNKYTKNMSDQGEGSWMSNEFPPRLLEHADLKHIKDAIMSHFCKFMYEALGCNRQTNAVFTTSWLAAIDKGGYIHSHSHANCWFSGLLYFGDDYTTAVPLHLKDPKATQSSILVDSKRYNVGQPVSIQPEKNLLIFFPSYIVHSSEAQMSDKRRWSLAFNFYPKGKVGEELTDSYLDTKWLSS